MLQAPQGVRSPGLRVKWFSTSLSRARPRARAVEPGKVLEEERAEASTSPDVEVSDPMTSKPQAPGGTAGSRFTILGLPPTPEVLAISLVYLVQGMLGLSRLAVSFYFKDELHLDPAELAIFSGLSALPWLIKPFYGFISDTFPLLGYRRRSYLALCGLLGTVAWGSAAFLHPDAYTLTILLLIGSASTACSDVVVDSIVVEASRGAPAQVAGSYQSLSWGSSAIGAIISSYFSGALIEKYGTSFVFALTAMFPLFVVASALLIKEDRAHAASPSEQSSLRTELTDQMNTLWTVIRRPSILYPAMFVFIWRATPSADSALFYFYSEQLQFGPEFLGRVAFGGSVASLAGVWLYNTYFKGVELKTMFKWSAILGTAFSLTQLILVSGLNRSLGISDQWFCLSDEVVLTVLGRISFMPVLVLASRICPSGIEATLFATLMSLLNGGGVLGGLLGSGLTSAFGVSSDSFDNLATLIVICSLSNLVPLLLLRLVPSNDELTDDTDEKAS